MLYTIARWTLFPLLRLVFVRTVTGVENLPSTGPYIIASNHASYGDAPLLVAALDPHAKGKIHFVAWKALAKVWLLRWMIPAFGGVFENGSIDKLLDLLLHGHVVGIYPEGGRTHNGKIQKITHSGTGVLAADSGAPVIPVKTIGLYELWPYNKLLPRISKSIEFRIGKPLHYKGRTRKKDHVQFGNKVMKEIDAL
ncbi:1-acyl-sn-glycerol-3-phosphate acyltransferase [Candidatus Woesearchaeota archaeon]|nr:1-acyl-sn-glycerol-3-phosphate acyltransferase [Candidatus Woesearchaeota archaeon]